MRLLRMCPPARGRVDGGWIYERIDGQTGGWIETASRQDVPGAWKNEEAAPSAECLVTAGGTSGDWQTGEALCPRHLRLRTAPAPDTGPPTTGSLPCSSGAD